MKKFLSLILVFITVLSVSGQAYAISDTYSVSNSPKTYVVKVSAPTIDKSILTLRSDLSNASSTSKSMSVSASASCTSNNHVGNEWGQSFSVNGKKISGSSTVSLKVGDVVRVEATVTEYDDSRDDVGTNSASKTITQSDLNNGFTLSFDVTVTENGGRYSGNSAKWAVKYSFS